MDHEHGILPGFRFHPTDEELVSFYLRRKIEKKLIRIEFIKQIDIYKYEPWDLPKNSSVTDKELYFFSKRGRKYKNSIRPNRVTGSGFWKATGIDKPIYSVQGKGRHECIGLKKSLVYYRGSAGKGTKTDWMMHEFRLPADQKNTSTSLNVNVNANVNANATAPDEEVEIWTLCRIFKRDMSQRKYTPGWRELVSAKRKPINSRPEVAENMDSENQESYIWFGAPEEEEEKEAVVAGNVNYNYNMNERKQLCVVSEQESSSSVLSDEAMEFFAHSNWDDIVSAMDYAFGPYHF